MEPSMVSGVRGREKDTESDEVFILQQVSSETESNGQSITLHIKEEQPIQMEQDHEQSASRKAKPTSPPRTTRNRPDLYNFKGFMFLCFGVPGIAPNWCSCLLFFYYMLLFTVGIGTIVLGAISLTLRDELAHAKHFIFADTLAILAGLLYLLAAFYGGCIWTWRTSFLPGRCTRSFLPLSITAWLLSLTHTSLMAAYVTIMINYGYEIVNDDLKFKLNLLSLWTLGGLVVWGVSFLLGLIPGVILFRRKYRPIATRV